MKISQAEIWRDIEISRKEKGNVSECLVRGKCQFGVWR